MILVTGGAGYIGSHTCVALAQAHHPFVILDNFSNSRVQAIHQIAQISGHTPDYVQGDVCDANLLEKIFKQYDITGVIHFAASKYVDESVTNPLAYYANNMTGLLTLLQAMRNSRARVFVFSSSASVYGNPHQMPIKEDTPLQPISPYGHTKAMGEQILHDLAQAHSDWQIANLRYFNPIGFHPSALITGHAHDGPHGLSLLEYVLEVAAQKRPTLKIFGGDYNTPDGTPIRDFIHIMDLARGHVLALEYLFKNPHATLTANLGTGQGISVLEVVKTFEKVCQVKLPYEIVGRRDADIESSWADSNTAQKLLGWTCQRSLQQMLEDAWRVECRKNAT